MPINLDAIRERLSYIDSVPLLSVLGVLSGLASGAIILLFRLFVEIPLEIALDGDFDNFESLPVWLRVALPIVGAIILGVIFLPLPKFLKRTGIAFVIERFNRQQGVMSARSLFLQFGTAVISLTCGHSLGREGPAVHIGAASSSLIGQWAGLPNNSLRILVGCGVAAAISACFDTPLAGVIFAMEVVMLEYSIITFTPIILASVVAAMLSKAVYAHEPAFGIPTTITLTNLQEIPLLIACGLIIGCIAALFTYLTREIIKQTSEHNHFIRFITAGGITGGLAIVVPEVLGIGYDTVTEAALGKITIEILLLICAAKLVASSFCAASGLPAGIIGPCMVIGATAGGAVGMLAIRLFPGADPGLYVMVGLVAMMGATLQAPLAALIALLELTGNPNIIFPGMLTVILACMMVSQVFKQSSFFLSTLQAQGIELKSTAFARHLNRAAVPAVMERNFKRVPATLSLEEATTLIKAEPVWIVVEDQNTPNQILHLVDLVNFLQNKESKEKPPEIIDLLQMPASRLDVAPVLMSATLKEALDEMDKNNADAVYVRRMNAPQVYRMYGIVTRQDIERFYKI